MLRTLEIHDILLIDRLAVDFHPGLNALTGETGAGKSILLDALGLALGWRSRAGLVRAGAARGEVTAVFDLPPAHPARAVLEEADIPAPEDELILRRTVTGEGRKQGWANDRRVSAEVLRALGAQLVELHGQGDDAVLLNPRGHRALLDAFGGHQAELAATARAWEALAKAERALDQARAQAEAAARDEEWLRHAVAEIAELAPEPGEDAALDARRRMMKAAARIGQDIAAAAEALGGEMGATPRAADALRRLEAAAGRADVPLDPALDALSAALDALSAAEAEVAAAARSLAFDEAELVALEDRLFALRGLARKHGVPPDELAALGEQLAARLEALDAGEARIAELARARDAARAGYDEAAAALHAAREQAAGALQAAMAAELPPLKLDRARFRVALTPTAPGPQGSDAVAFVAATNPGAPWGPLEKVASGGELSRFLLALRVCIAADGGASMIFDEIDRGVGGATAEAVGRRLRALGGRGQVIVVTHSPQVAAQAHHHLRVAKRVAGGQTLSTVTPLEGDARIDEIARMLAGETITQAARDAARALLPRS